jgi:tRNA pseudouridine38-40 synthase
VKLFDLMLLILFWLIFAHAAFERFVGHPVVRAASSRTDTGVHATANVCHVDVVRYSKRKPGEVMPPHEPETVKKAVNHFLQKEGDDVAIVDVQRVPLDFHARFQAKERTYVSLSYLSRDWPSVSV